MLCLNRFFMALLSLVVLNGCGIKIGSDNREVKQLPPNLNSELGLVFLNVKNPEALQTQAKKLGLSIEGDVVMTITGPVEAMAQLDLSDIDATQVMGNQVIQVEKPLPFNPAKIPLYLAKEDFGILDFWKKYPEADGRGVVVGVLDDGISPGQNGFMVTTTGQRKLLKKGGQSSLLTFQLSADPNTSGVFIGDINEDLKNYADASIDFNGNGLSDVYSVKVSAGQVCLDLDKDTIFSHQECKGNFSATGDFFISPGNLLLSFIAEFDESTSKLSLTQPELIDDSHGEGVASVLTGHRIGGLEGFNGVAPGAQLLDYDLNVPTNLSEEQEYNIGTFLRGLEWLGKNGAEVVNISYSLFFSSLEAQNFMAQAIDSIVKKYNMVISFSAGNNGPGLGSMNRRSLYPDSVLIAGAFVSKKLDEVVHGVTGLPEEGRVVYYSSRGPGPQNQDGPMLISPLSTLTYSDPQSGFGAFSGTSSASPALAGAASVLLSEIKKEGLKVDAPSVVHALRMSGKQLTNEPFVSQGYGLPQVEQALLEYKKILNGQKFININAEVSKDDSNAPIANKAIFLKASEVSIKSYFIELQGIVSALAPQTTKDLLVPVSIEYSPGINGPQNLWVSSGWSRLYVDIHPQEILEEKAEAFAEIRIKDLYTGELLKVIPVTIINDLLLKGVIETNLKVSAQEGKRIHLDVPAGVQGIRIKPQIVEGEARFLRVSVYGPDKIRKWQKALSEEMWMPVTIPGHYQITLSMGGGTPREALVKFQVSPIRVKMINSELSSSSSTLELQQSVSSSSALPVLVQILPRPEVLAKIKKQENEIPGPLSLDVQLEKQGTYNLVMKPVYKVSVLYPYASCSGKIIHADGKVELTQETYKKKDEEKVMWNVRCSPFEMGMWYQLKDSWIMSVERETDAVVEKGPIFLRQSAVNVKIPETPPGTYDVVLKNPLGDETISIGEVEFFK